jgi:hypothetical protein
LHIGVGSSGVAEAAVLAETAVFLFFFPSPQRVAVVVTPRIFAVEFFLFFTRQIQALPFLFLFALARP